MQPEFGELGDPAAVIGEAARAFVPAEAISTAEWAARHRWVTGSRAGRWRHDTAPFLVEPMNALDDPAISDVVIPGPARSGKTAIAENWLLKSIDVDPGPMGWYLNSDDVRASYVKDTINPLLLAHEAVARKRGGGPTDDSLGYKRFHGMAVQFLVATASNLVNKTFQRVFADEVDNYDPAFGDPKTAFDARRSSYGADSKLMLASHPDRAIGLDPAEWRAGIMYYYAMSSRGTWWWPCRRCGGFSSPNPGTPRHCVLAWPPAAPIEEIAAETHLLCPVCDAHLIDADRLVMNRDGVWLHRGQSIDEDGRIEGARAPNPMAGFWIVGAMSPFLLTGIGGLALARVRAERGLVDDDEDAENTLKAVLTKAWGFPLIRPKQAGAADVASVAERCRADLTIGTVPEGVRFIMAGIDVQASRFEILWRGFGPGMESWVIEVVRVAAEPAINPADWDAVLQLALEKTFPLADRSGRVMRVRAVGFDSGGEKGVTGNAYEAWRRAKVARIARSFGLVAHRETWNLLPLKGASARDATRLMVNLADGGKRDRFTRSRGDVPLGVFNANQFKDSLTGQLARAEPGPPAVHIPAAMRGAPALDYPAPPGAEPAEPRNHDAPHRWLEQLFAERRLRDGRWEKLTSSARNEALDLMVMTHVMAHLHASRIDWKRPPLWAAEWDANAMVRGPGAAVKPVARPAALPDEVPAPEAIGAQRNRMPGQPAPRSLGMMLP